MRRSGGSVSGRNAESSNSSSPIAASTPNTPRQLVNRSICPPITGASTGASPKTSISEPSTRASSVPVYWSRTIASDSTTPPAPAMPCRNRKTISAPMSGAAAHATDSTVNATRPASSGFFRPRPSLSGPATSCPTASPARQPDSVSCTSDCDACRFAAIVGVDGRYMSIESGPNDDSAPSTASIPSLRFCRTAGTTKVSIANKSYAGAPPPPTCDSPVVTAPFRR